MHLFAITEEFFGDLRACNKHSVTKCSNFSIPHVAAVCGLLERRSLTVPHVFGFAAKLLRMYGFCVRGLPLLLGIYIWLFSALAVANEFGATRVSVVPILAKTNNGADPTLVLYVNPASGVAPLRVTFSLISEFVPRSVALDAEGDGVIDFTGRSLEGQSFTYAALGRYFPTVTGTGGRGEQFTASAVVLVENRDALDALLQSKWAAPSCWSGRHAVSTKWHRTQQILHLPIPPRSATGCAAGSTPPHWRETRSSPAIPNSDF